MNREIPLTQGKVTVVDDIDFEWLNQWKWHAHRIPKKTKEDTWYAERRQWNPDTKTYTSISMHRQIMDFPKDKDVDHINGDGLYNRRCNLRKVSRRQNQQNKRAPKSSKYPGVCWDTWTNKWVVNLSINGKQTNIGRFKTEEEAFNAYKKAVNKYCNEDVIPELQ